MFHVQKVYMPLLHFIAGVCWTTRVLSRHALPKAHLIKGPMCNEKGWYVTHGDLCCSGNATVDRTSQRAPNVIRFRISCMIKSDLGIYVLYCVT